MIPCVQTNPGNGSNGRGKKKKNGLLCSFEDHCDIMEGFEMGRKSNKTFNNPATERGVKALVRMGTNAMLA